MPEQEPGEKNNGNQAESPTELKGSEALKQSLAEERAKAEKYLANWQRAEADFINYKRRSQQEKEEAKQAATATLMLELLPFLDDLERALAVMPPQLADDGWVDGLRQVGRKLQSALERQGLSPIKALGEPFDPKFHEAVRQGSGKEGIIIQEVEKGYLFRDRVIRPAKVAVGNGEEAEKKEE